MHRGLGAAIVAGVLALGGGVAAHAVITGSDPVASCTSAPAVSDNGDSQSITVTCDVPKPPASTVTDTATVTATETATATETVTVPGPTTTATATQTVTVPGPTQTVTVPGPTVTATTTATVTASPSSSPTPPPTTSAAPTPTPTVTATSTPSSFPDASNTGVPAGTTLTTYTGPANITAANTVISGKTIGCIQISAPGVVIKNSHIACANPGTYVVEVDDPTSYGWTAAQRPVLQDVEIDCKNGGGTAVGEASVTVLRANIHGCENGFDLNQRLDLRDSYIHDLWNSGESHTDGIQFGGGYWNGSAYTWNGGSGTQGARDISIVHNTIYGVGYDGTLGTSAIISNPKGDSNILIQDNLLGGGAFTLYCDYSATGSNYRVTGNHFTKKFSSKYGAFGVSDGCSDETLSGNVDDTTGAAIKLD